MKELKSHIKEEVKMHVETKQEKQKILFDSFERQPGQQVWELDLKTQEIRLAEFSNEYASIDGSVTRDIIMKDNCWYEPALNKENAFRRFNNRARFIVTGKTKQP